MDHTFAIILDYCGGSKTDKLYEQLKAWNPDTRIHILDNASPSEKSRYITHQNRMNSFIGGGIKDCISLAKENKSKFLLFITNDIRLLNKIYLKSLERIMFSNPDMVQLSVSLTPSSDKNYPWMFNQGRNELREVHHSDFLFTLLRLSFIEDFGGFPDSKSGWGYDWEFGYHAHHRKKMIVISDQFLIEHLGNRENVSWKHEEMCKIYNAKYGDYRKIFQYDMALGKNEIENLIEKCKTISPIIVIGMYWSGASFLSEVLEEAGVLMGVEKDQNNESLIFSKTNELCLAKNGYDWIRPGMAELSITDEALALIILRHFGFYRPYKDQIGSNVEREWGWKNPGNTFTLNIWLRYFPMARVIHIYRNGISVAENLYQRNSEIQSQSGFFSKDLEDKRYGFKLWEKYVEAAESYRHKLRDNFLGVCFEKIILGDLEEIQRLEEYLDLKLMPIIKKKANRGKALSISDLKTKDFSDEKGFLKKFGYIN